MRVRGKSLTQLVAIEYTSGMDVRERFREWVEAQGGGTAVARRLGCSKSFVSVLMTKKEHRQNPSWPMAKLIEEQSGIPAMDWMNVDPTRRPSRRGARRRPPLGSEKAGYLIILDNGKTLVGEFMEANRRTESGQRILVGRLVSTAATGTTAPPQPLALFAEAE